MDEAFSVFIEEVGEPTHRQEVPASTIERYKGSYRINFCSIGWNTVPPASLDHYQGKLPNQLLTYWQDHGWCGYGGGLFWMVNPQEYEDVVAQWLAGG